MARAYLDQFRRSGELSASVVADLTSALDLSAAQLEDGAHDKDLANRLNLPATDLDAGSDDDNTRKRQAGLAKTLTRIAARLQ